MVVGGCVVLQVCDCGEAVGQVNGALLLTPGTIFIGQKNTICFLIKKSFRSDFWEWPTLLAEIDRTESTTLFFFP